jgi:hypothetical protein
MLGESSIMKRMVCSIMHVGATNTLVLELARSVRDILGIPYDDSEPY